MRPHRARHWGTNDHLAAGEFNAACLHLCFPVRQCDVSGYSPSEGGILQASRPPAEHPPFRLAPAHALPFIPPRSFGLWWDRMLEAVLTAPPTISHRWHHAIVTSHQSNPCLAPLMSDSDPTRPTLLRICHGCTHVHGWDGKKEKKELSRGECRILYHGCFKVWCSAAANIKAFNLCNLCCLGGRSVSNCFSVYLNRLSSNWRQQPEHSESLLSVRRLNGGGTHRGMWSN